MTMYTHSLFGDVRSLFAVSIQRTPADSSGLLSLADASWPRRLRRILRASLTHWRHSELIESAELLLTELVTNALCHGKGDLGVRVHLGAGRLVIAVSDGSTNRPTMRCAGPEDLNGRGLFLMDVLASEWGVSADGMTIWCALPMTEGPPTMRPLPVGREVLSPAEDGGKIVRATLRPGPVAP